MLVQGNEMKTDCQDIKHLSTEEAGGGRMACKINFSHAAQYVDQVGEEVGRTENMNDNVNKSISMLTKVKHVVKIGLNNQEHFWSVLNGTAVRSIVYVSLLFFTLWYHH